MSTLEVDSSFQLKLLEDAAGPTKSLGSRIDAKVPSAAALIGVCLDSPSAVQSGIGTSSGSRLSRGMQAATTGSPFSEPL